MRLFQVRPTCNQVARIDSFVWFSKCWGLYSCYDVMVAGWVLCQLSCEVWGVIISKYWSSHQDYHSNWPPSPAHPPVPGLFSLHSNYFLRIVQSSQSSVHPVLPETGLEPGNNEWCGMPCWCYVERCEGVRFSVHLINEDTCHCVCPLTFLALPGHNMEIEIQICPNNVYRLDNMLAAGYHPWSSVTESLLVRILLKIISPPADIHHPGVPQSLYFPLSFSLSLSLWQTAEQCPRKFWWPDPSSLNCLNNVLLCPLTRRLDMTGFLPIMSPPPSYHCPARVNKYSSWIPICPACITGIVWPSSRPVAFLSF